MPTPKRSQSFFALLLLIVLLISFGVALRTQEAARASENLSTAAATIRINTTGNDGFADPRLLGTNVPAWLNPTRMNDTKFQNRTIASGATVIRLPGGSWSNSYDWLACERFGVGIDGDAECRWSWASRPTDFIDYLQATGNEVMYAVNQNGTSKEAAALVAFFNGSVSDNRVIGVDVRGRDWGKVSDWAKLRRDNGNPDPLYVKYWEVGNEIYGGKPGNGKDCLSYGWERTWTCDGTEYVNGMGSGSDRKEGYLEFRNAMRAVDSSIMVGAVGNPYQSGWSNWGNEVIAAAGSVMDFYSIHQYAYFNPPSGYSDVLAQPQGEWAPIMQDIEASFDQNAGGRRVPIAVTEYNLFSVGSQDSGDWMSQTVNALFLADTIGQMMVNGFDIANQWDIAHGEGSDSPSYGLMQAATYFRAPQYYVYPLWSKFGTKMLPVTSSLRADTTLSVYAGQTHWPYVTLLAINKTGNALSADIYLDNAAAVIAGTADVMMAPSLSSTSVTYNGVADPTDNLSNAPATSLGNVGNPTSYSFAPYSITLLRFTLFVDFDNFIYVPLVDG